MLSLTDKTVINATPTENGSSDAGKPVSEVESVAWEQGLIAKLERFLVERYPIPDLWARAIGIALVSIALHNVKHFETRYGKLKPNVFIVYIARSGMGFKSTVLNRVIEIVLEWNPDLLGPSRFTTEGLYDYINGRKDENGKPISLPHDSFIIIRDELSNIFKDSRRDYMNRLLEDLSMLYDGKFEPYATRKYGLEQFEWKTGLYVVLVSATTEHFLKLMNEDFFIQGLGNRFLYVVGDNPKIEKLDPHEFFYNSEDEEWKELKKEIVEDLKKIEEAASAFVFPEAGKMWTDFQYECYKEAVETGDEYIMRLPEQALKLAIIYAASRFDIKFRVVNVREEDMRRAIEDVKRFKEQYVKVGQWWIEQRRTAKEEPYIRPAKYDLKNVCYLAATMGGGYCTVREISAWLKAPGKHLISDLLENGVDAGYFEALSEYDVPPHLRERFRPKRGPYPTVYRLTEKGYEFAGVEPPKQGNT